MKNYNTPDPVEVELDENGDPIPSDPIKPPKDK